MNSIKLNSEILNDIFNDSDFSKEIFECLNDVIENEISKGDSADCDLIDECIDALEQLSTENGIATGSLLRLLSREKFVKTIKNHSTLGHRSQKRILAACAAVALIFSAGTVYSYNISGVSLVKNIENKISNLLHREQVTDYTQENETEEPTLAVITQNESVEDVTSETTQPLELPMTTEPVTRAEDIQNTLNSSILAGIHADIPKTVKTDYIIGEQLLTDGIKMYAEMQDGSVKEISISECEITIPQKFYRDAGKYFVKIAYGEFETNYMVTVNAIKESVVLNSIYGSFDDDFNFTVSDFDNIDLSNMTVMAIYSDGSQREISSADYTVNVEKGFMGMGNKALVTVSYEEREFSFVLTLNGGAVK